MSGSGGASNSGHFTTTRRRFTPSSASFDQSTNFRSLPTPKPSVSGPSCWKFATALSRHGTDTLIGLGPAHSKLLDQIEAASISSVPVLITGEPGTGKRLVAKTIHLLSPRRQSPFLAFACGALPADVLNRELFGASQGPDSRVRPDLALPDGATLLMLEILSLPRDLQAKLVVALDRRIRLIATAVSDPEAAYGEERIRPDLYHVLTTLVIRLSPLRDRLDELSLLAQHFLERMNQRGGRQRSGFHNDSLAVFLGYDWPGNLSELARVVEHAHEHGEQDLIQPDDLPAAIRGHLGAAYIPPPPPPTASLDDLLTQVERRLIESALQRARHNKSRTAELLGISRPRLYRRIKELELPDLPESDEPSES